MSSPSLSRWRARARTYLVVAIALTLSSSVVLVREAHADNAEKSRVIVAVVGVEPAVTFRDGPGNSGPPGFSTSLGVLLAGQGHTKNYVFGLTLDGSLGVGYAGLQGTADTVLAGGLRIPFDHRDVRHSLFLRAGLSAPALVSNRAQVTVVDLPFGEAGYSLVGAPVSVQVYGRFGLAALTRLSSGRRFEDLDYRRELEPSPEWGFGALVAIGESLYAEGRFVTVAASDSRGSVRYATARACVFVVSPLAACARFTYGSGDVKSVRDVPAGVDPWSTMTVALAGLTLGVGGTATPDQLPDSP